MTIKNKQTNLQDVTQLAEKLECRQLVWDLLVLFYLSASKQVLCITYGKFPRLNSVYERIYTRD